MNVFSIKLSSEGGVAQVNSFGLFGVYNVEPGSPRFGERVAGNLGINVSADAMVLAFAKVAKPGASLDVSIEALKYFAESASLFSALADGGYKVSDIFDEYEEKWVPFVGENAYDFALAVSGVDEASVRIVGGSSRASNNLFLVFGNSPGELVADYLVGDPDLDGILEAWSDSLMNN